MIAVGGGLDFVAEVGLVAEDEDSPFLPQYFEKRDLLCVDPPVEWRPEVLLPMVETEESSRQGEEVMEYSCLEKRAVFTGSDFSFINERSKTSL